MLEEQNHIAILSGFLWRGHVPQPTHYHVNLFSSKMTQSSSRRQIHVFRATCQHLWKKVPCAVLACCARAHAHTRTHTVLTQGVHAVSKQQRWDLNSSLGDSLKGQAFCITGRTGASSLSVGLSKGLESELDLNSGFTHIGFMALGK